VNEPPTPAANVLDRARADIDAGRIWKARDRLTAAFKHDPSNQRLLALLGEVYFEMGDLPHAGRLWILTDREGTKADAALSAFEERWGGNPGEKLKMVPFNGTINDYPSPARERIGALQDEAHRNGIEWPPEKHQSSSDESMMSR
jgi:tetratricopeptide (TPR) repeat protein